MVGASEHENWSKCLAVLRQTITPQEQSMWLAPLQIEEAADLITLYCPNQHVKRLIDERCLPLIQEVASVLRVSISTCVGYKKENAPLLQDSPQTADEPVVAPKVEQTQDQWWSRLNPAFTLDQYVLGSFNQMGYTAAKLVVMQPGSMYNPLVLYGDVGLGKTHLMQAIGHALQDQHCVRYVHSERFVSMMIRALQTQSMPQFKESFRKVSVLLLDDIQFFVNKERSQEELFHIMNALLDGGMQMVVTCDRFPKELEGMEDRLKSRFSCGLTVGIDPPDLEARVAILLRKAALSSVDLPDAVAFYIAERITGNVRELEGALKRLIANAFFTGEAITIPFAQMALRDLFQMHARLISIESIQKVVAKYYKVKMSDLTGLSRKQSLVLSRQMAMYLIKELTGHSLPEIGVAFGNRDHTTVLHAIRKVRSLSEKDEAIRLDLEALMRLLS